MNIARNKFQDIYDAGAQRLDELLRGQKARLQDDFRKHTEATSSIEHDATLRLEERAKDLQTDIEARITSSLERIQKALDYEIAHNERHLKALNTRLHMAARELNDRIANLQDGHTVRLRSLSERTTDEHSTTCDSMTSQLSDNCYSSLNTLKQKGNGQVNSFRQMLHNSLSQAQDSEHDCLSKLSQVYLEETAAIDTHTSSCLDRMASTFSSEMASLYGTFHAAEQDISGYLQACSEEADQHAMDIQQQVHEFFERLSFTTTQRATARLDEFNAGLDTLKQSCSQAISQELAAAENELRKHSEAARTQLQDSCTAMRNSVQSSSNALTDENNTRLGTSRSMLESLQTLAGQIKANTEREWAELQAKFEAKLEKAREQAMSDLDALISSTEQSLLQKRQDCEEQLRNLTSQNQETIDQASFALIQTITQHRDAALQELAQAAGNSSGEGKPKRKSKK